MFGETLVRKGQASTLQGQVSTGKLTKEQFHIFCGDLIASGMEHSSKKVPDAQSVSLVIVWIFDRDRIARSWKKQEGKSPERKPAEKA